ncbi:hypothetical protein OF363_01120 [Mycoplasma enhydrae]|uniref:hypothetical protein n=1 Tax=Mycoplasma enhydrae TaxID=2499220 RepID=UPI0021E77CE4|nr:hypothetical protein [Mycoplasma enhydrae]MCV3733636.1 hypothetical protein [Mycoplasma enhydrae]
MKAKKTNFRKNFGIAATVLIPVFSIASVGGAIYYFTKNSRPVQKEFWSVEKFEQAAKEIKIKNEVISSKLTEDIYKDFKSRKSFSEEALKNFYKKYPNLNKLSKAKQAKILKDKPKPFDTHKYLENYINSNLDFNKTKFLNFRFVDIEKVKENNKQLKVYFEVFLNYEYANGVFESNKIKSTSNSKYYYRSSQNVNFLSDELNDLIGSEFDKSWPKNEKKIIDIIKKYNKKKGEKENVLKEWNAELSELQKKPNQTEDDKNKIEDLTKKIAQITIDLKTFFESEEFQKEVFKWFEKVIDETNAYPDTWPKDKSKIVPLIEKNEFYVTWIPTKNLNELKIKFKFENKNDNKQSSDGRVKIFNLNEV